jgi:hypothetical protein
MRLIDLPIEGACAIRVSLVLSSAPFEMTMSGFSTVATISVVTKSFDDRGMETISGLLSLSP